MQWDIKMWIYTNHNCCDKRAWAESEYIEKPVISKKDKAFLEYLDKKYEYLARDTYTSLYAYSANRFAHFKILRKQRYYRYWNGYLGFTRVHGETRYNEAKNAEIADRVSM